MLRRSLDHLAESKTRLVPENVTSAERWREVNREFARRPDVAASALAFWEAMARRYGVRWIYSDSGRVPVLDASERWTLERHERSVNGRHEMALYRLADDASP